MHSSFHASTRLRALFLIAALASGISAQAKFRVLVFNKPGTKSDGGKIEHASIATLSTAIVAWSKELGFEAVPTVDAAQFTEANLGTKVEL